MTIAPGLEIATATGLVEPFRPHQHDCYVVGLTTTGVQSFQYRGEQRHALAGEAFAIHPGETHDGRPGTDGGYGYRAAYVAPELVATALGGRTFPFSREAVGRNAELVSSLENLFGLAATNADKIATTDGIARLADALVKLSSDGRTRRAPQDRQLAMKLRDDLTENAASGRSMTELERDYGLDRFSICRLFRRHFGVSPQSYLIQRRVGLARSKIAKGMTLAEAAISSGFSDQSHMSRHFVKAVGTSPGRWSELTTNPVSRHSPRPDE
ncbi:AraC family transcriptional regulator [Ruegeria pomeroyi]|nr:AraC family transcriptional regulator [Ruegeria pomeroyi]